MSSFFEGIFGTVLQTDLLVIRLLATRFIFVRLQLCWVFFLRFCHVRDKRLFFLTTFTVSFKTSTTIQTDMLRDGNNG